jgi:hypothetical protein
MTTVNTNTDITVLDPRKQRFVHLYITGQYKNTDLANLLEVHPNTIQSWLRDETVRELIDDYQRSEHELVDLQLKAMRMKALAKMNDLMDSPIDGIAYQASKDILDRTGHKSRQEIKVDKTVTTIEEKLNSVIDSAIDVDFEVINDG